MGDKYVKRYRGGREGVEADDGPKKWSKRDENLLITNWFYVSKPDIAARLNRSVDSVLNKGRKLRAAGRLPAEPESAIITERHADVMRLIAGLPEGATYKQIAVIKAEGTTGVIYELERKGLIWRTGTRGAYVWAATGKPYGLQLGIVEPEDHLRKACAALQLTPKQAALLAAYKPKEPRSKLAKAMGLPKVIVNQLIVGRKRK
jgi:hypothetical protein